MTKEEIRRRLLAGETLDSILPFRSGQECEIFKAENFALGDEVIYVPDIYLNEIPVDEDLSKDEDWINYSIENCYTGNDILNDCGGNEELARRVFNFIDWQHPSSAANELEDDIKEEEEQ